MRGDNLADEPPSTLSESQHSEIHGHGEGKIGRVEIAIIICVAAIYVYLRFFYGVGTIFGFPLYYFLLPFGFAVGVWLALRMSELAVRGLGAAAIYFGLSLYAVGVLSSIASNTPELVIGLLMSWRGYTHPDPVVGLTLTETSILTVLTASGFNTLLLSLIIILGSTKKGRVRVPREVILHESELIRSTFIAIMMIFMFGLILHVFPVGGGAGGIGYIPRIAALCLLLIYVSYVIQLLRRRSVNMTISPAKTEPSKPPENNLREHNPAISKRLALVFIIVAFLGIFIAGEIITSTVELAIEHLELAIPVVALIVGACGSIPEHGIALVAARKGQINVALGNIIGGLAQIVLMVLGVVGIVVPIPLDAFVLFQLIVTGWVLYYVKRAILDDECLDAFEGFIILVFQILAFSLLLGLV
ncbi:MAG: sodium:calcium antiporter [Candidatus Hodarchaeota archaeon]